MKAKLFLPIMAVAITAVTLYGTSQIMAFSGGGNHTELIQKLASAFGKSETEVQTVFDEFRTEQQADREAEFATRLDQAVTDGKLTADQKELVLAKHAELQAQHEADFANKNTMTQEEWHTQRQTEREALESWAETNGIDLSYIMPERSPMGEGRGMGRGMHGAGFGQEFGQE